VALNIHGEWHLAIVRDIVIASLSGTWNEEAMLAYALEYKALLKSPGRYCVLVRFDRWHGSTPEANLVAYGLRRWAYEQGCACEAWVEPDEIMRRWLNWYARDPDGMHEQRPFATVEEAVAWLADLGFHIDLAELPPNWYARTDQ
jgi:hypothetical protein